MSKRLEDFISQNREQFDDLEPRADIWANIAKELDTFDEQQAQLPIKKEAKTFSLSFVLKVAASVIVVMGLGFAVYLKTLKTNNNGVDLADINPSYAKQQVHLVSVIETQKNELKQIAKFDPQLYQEFNGEITRMQSIYKKLNAELATSPNQERVLRAMIRNLQIQTEVLNQQLSVIQQFNDSKNEQHEKSI
ncbi:hypothetical protein FPZ42_17505 [Mucilaginibacter achroorhodeus]|uniref:Anti-sigma factor n=1 Tax=Mucilaginibacter achroorhodeus TaxID=2599294 RepID=A0A563TY36_9SPHI|nr:hypothetical protein [Mucilaginibacter achroorhodeus]TWR24278.1 hypothetical protein FPZ42_17505 [Mucilaginibacter achroorhodeus]